MLDELRNRVENILDKCPDQDREKYLIIKIIMMEQDWYNKLDIDTFVSILVDLEYTIEEAKDIYMKLKGIN